MIPLTVREKQELALMWARLGKASPPDQAPQESTEPIHLSAREEQLVELISEGKANKLIAFEMGITQGTVKIYLNRLFRKVGVTNRTELAVWALRR